MYAFRNSAVSVLFPSCHTEILLHVSQACLPTATPGDMLAQSLGNMTSYLQMTLVHPAHKRNLASNIGGGGAKLTMGIRNSILQGLRFEGRDNWSHKTQVFHFFCQFFICHYSI
jgi:hypothetical protein